VDEQDYRPKTRSDWTRRPHYLTPFVENGVNPPATLEPKLIDIFELPHLELKAVVCFEGQA
jgi:hypothetical protein